MVITIELVTLVACHFWRGRMFRPPAQPKRAHFEFDGLAFSFCQSECLLPLDFSM